VKPVLGVPAIVDWTWDKVASKLVFAVVAILLTLAACFATKAAASDAIDAIVVMCYSGLAKHHHLMVNDVLSKIGGKGWK
jgi:hypothetical protein